MQFKSSILFLLFLLMFTSGYAKTVDETTARKVAVNFFRTVGADVTDLSIASTATENINGIPVPCYYIFNTQTAFVIVAASNATSPILAYSTQRPFNTAITNETINFWLGAYSANIATLIKQHVTASKQTAAKWNLLREGTFVAAKTTATVPLLTTQWAQYPVYNNYCPYDQLYKAYTVAGCVSTAMAQVMNFWKWPSTGCGSHAYTHTLYGPLSVNFSQSKYDWTAMNNGAAIPDQAIAKLMYDAGESVNTDFGLHGSIGFAVPLEFSTSNVAAYSLKTYFHYKSTLKPLWRGDSQFTPDFSDDQWMSMIRNEIDHGRPVLYGGYAHYTIPHCWVCDGYDNNDLFHFNWGWAGSYDGYFTLADGGGYNTQQHMVIGIEPDPYPDLKGDIQLQAPLISTSSPSKYGQPFSISTTIVNKSAATFNGDFCARIFDSSGAMSGTVQTITGLSIAPGDSTAPLTFSTTGMYNLYAGFYTTQVLYRPSGSTDWQPVANNGNIINYDIRGIANDTDLLIYRTFELSTDSLTHGKPATITAWVANIGRTRFTSNLDLSLYDLTTGAKVYTIGNLKDQLFNIYTPYQLTFADSELRVMPGKYMMMLTHQYCDSGNYFVTGTAWQPNPVIVTVGGIKDYNSNQVYIYPNPAKDIIYIDPYYNHLHELRIIDIRGAEMMKMTNITPDKTITVSVKDFPTGVYFVQCRSSLGVTVQKILR
jgi:hypothetical protein